MDIKSKVVRVEETLNPGAPQKNHDDLVLSLSEGKSSDAVNARSKSLLRSHTSTTQGTTDSGKNVTLVDEINGVIEERSLDTIEENDDVPPLPDNWPKIPAIFERRSWDFTTAVSPSINKAGAHLELLQGIIEEWFKEVETEQSRASSRKTFLSRPTTCLSQPSTVRSASQPKRQLRFRGGGSESALSQHTDGSLSVLGIGALDERGPHILPIAAATPIEEYELPFLGGDEVIEEVVSLLAKLENDRQETLESLKKERERSKVLKAQIDRHCQKRLVDLPKAVQAEHEACATDIAELNWHVNFNTRNEETLIRQCDNAQALNNKLKEDIEFIKSHIPLVQEKLELEKEAMARIEQAQKDTDDELNVVARRCGKVQAKSDEAHRKAEEERDSIRRDLESVRDDLARITEELSVAKMNYNSYIHQANDYRQQIQDNEQEVKVLTVKSENARAAEAIQDTKVKELQKKIKEAEYEQKKLEEENTELRDTKEWKKHRNEKAVAELNERIEDHKDKLRKLKRNNNELDMDIEDAQFKLNECERQKLADDKNVERMIKELDRTEQQYDMTLEELAQINIVNQATREQLISEEERTLQSEEQLRATADALKRQVKEEIHSRTMIQARMNADNEEQEKFEQETTKKKALSQEKAKKVEEAVKKVKKDVDNLRNEERSLSRNIAELKKQLEKYQAEIKSILDESEARKKELSPEYDELKTKVTDLTKHIDTMNWKQENMTSEIEEKTAVLIRMEKAKKMNIEAIEHLKVELEEVNTQLEDAHQIDDELQSSLDMVNRRATTNDKHHREHMKARTGVLEQHKQSLHDNFALNKVIAADYRRLTHEYVYLRNRTLDGYDGNLSSEAAIKNLKQLQGLQQKMHTAMSVYYKYRGMYNQSELNRMQVASNANGVKVGRLQTDMDKALDKIADFLNNQLDGDRIRELAMDRVERADRGEDLSDIASEVTGSRPTTRMSTGMGGPFFGTETPVC